MKEGIPVKKVLPIMLCVVVFIIMPGEAFGKYADDIRGNEVSRPTPEVVERYADVTMTEEEEWELAAIIYLEARDQSFRGQQAVAEVVLNRVIADNFPDTVHDVLYAGAGTKYEQFSTIDRIDSAEPTQTQFDAIKAAFYGSGILPDDVVYFSLRPENDRIWGRIDNHVFCYQYVWE